MSEVQQPLINVPQSDSSSTIAGILSKLVDVYEKLTTTQANFVKMANDLGMIVQNINNFGTTMSQRVSVLEIRVQQLLEKLGVNVEELPLPNGVQAPKQSEMAQ